MNQPIKINVILPVYNPPSNWEEKVLTSCTFIREKEPLYDWQFHFVNDGSTRHCSLDKLRHTQLEGIHVYEYAQNKGKGFAVRYGFQQAGEAEFYMYSDWDFPFGEHLLIDAAKKLQIFPIVLVNRGDIYYDKLPILRKLLTFTQRFINKYVLRLKQHDTQGGFKGFNQKARPLFMATTINEFLFDTEFIALGRKMNLNIDSIVVKCRKDIQFTNFRPTVLLKELKNIPVIFSARYVKKNTLTHHDGLGGI